MTATASPVTPDTVRDTVVAWRRKLHQEPELSFHETRTAAFIAETLAGFGGLEISRPTATSVVARLVGTSGGPVLAMRADIDALPIHEANEHGFVSTSPGVMHACGHDGHTAMLLGAARVLASRRGGELRGEVRFIFQHAEELPPGGAAELVAAGVMKDVDLVIGAHLWLPLPFGQVGVKAGALMASPDTFRIVIEGAGGHAAMPQLTVDSVAIAAQVVTNLQHVVSRAVDPLASAVVSVTRIAGGTAANVIPGSVELEGTVRTFDPALRERIPQLMERIIAGVTSAHGARYRWTYERGYHPVLNDEQATDLLRRSVVRALGAAALTEAVPTMGGEDFSAYQQRAPGAFFFIGARNEERGIVHPHHHERFDLDERALDYGTRIFVAAAEEYLGTDVR
ncbi:MAG TPA: amidohydrolase [Gemmatimonadaceae bacterium]|nr:amidohydrolase [Gemmatimonadaceae bacterium]